MVHDRHADLLSVRLPRVVHPRGRRGADRLLAAVAEGVRHEVRRVPLAAELRTHPDGEAPLLGHLGARAQDDGRGPRPQRDRPVEDRVLAGVEDPHVLRLHEVLAPGVLDHQAREGRTRLARQDPPVRDRNLRPVVPAVHVPEGVVDARVMRVVPRLPGPLFDRISPQDVHPARGQRVETGLPVRGARGGLEARDLPVRRADRNRAAFRVRQRHGRELRGPAAQREARPGSRRDERHEPPHDAGVRLAGQRPSLLVGDLAGDAHPLGHGSLQQQPAAVLLAGKERDDRLVRRGRQRREEPDPEGDRPHTCSGTTKGLR